MTLRRHKSESLENMRKSVALKSPESPRDYEEVKSPIHIGNDDARLVEVCDDEESNSVGTLVTIDLNSLSDDRSYEEDPVTGAIGNNVNSIPELKFEIREVDVNDLSVSEAHILKDYYKQNKGPLTLEWEPQKTDYIKRNVFVLCVLPEFDNKIVGFAQIVFSKYGSWWVYNLMRRHKYRHATTTTGQITKSLTKGMFGGANVNLNGIGAEILKKAENFVIQEGGNAVHLAVKSKYISKLDSYYTSKGYVSEDFELYYYGATVIQYEKQLV